MELKLGPRATIWRYLPTWKVRDLLKTGSLYFSRIKKLRCDDPYEAAHSDGALLRFLAGASDEELVQQWMVLSATRETHADHGISCWHMNQDENFALWKIYVCDDAGHPTPQGLAIRTQVSALTVALRDAIQCNTLQAKIRPVTYVDHSRVTILDYEQVLCTKQSFYQYEREVRAEVFLAPGRTCGQCAVTECGHVKVADMDRLIDQVVLHPLAPPELMSEVRALMQRAGLSPDTVTKSRMVHRPLVEEFVKIGEGCHARDDFGPLRGWREKMRAEFVDLRSNYVRTDPFHDEDASE